MGERVDEETGIAASDILIVDGDHHAVAILSQGLREVGHSVRVASSAREALQHCAAQAPGLALLESALLAQGGLRVALDLRQRNIPFIVIATPNDTHAAKQAIDLDAFSYLIKPIDAQQLMPVIKAAMRVDKAQQGEARTRRRHREIPALSRHLGVALGVLMERYGITASEAYETLAEAARTQDCALDELATQVLRATEHANNWLNKPRPTKR
jgi:DNA-binding response OmpR family regulator